jgi:fatty acid/phospholipid biosynthesis enzyme
MALALDAMGGDLAPAATVEGALRARRARGLEVILVRDDARLRVELRRLGAVYARRVRAVARPSIGVVANAEEEEKGTDLTRAAASALRKPASGVHFNVYFERRDLFSGEVDVVATDGFTGNVLLETAEGAVWTFGQLRERQIHEAVSAAEAFAARRIEDELEEAAQRAAGLFEKNAA